MSDDQVTAVAMPQVNVNDEEVALIGWHVADGGRVTAGQPLCEVETSKSTGDMPAPADGVLRRIAEVGQVVAVGQIIAYIGASLEAIEAYQNAHADESATTSLDTFARSDLVDATAGALALARSAGINISQIPAEGRIRLADVERYLADHPEKHKAPAAHAPSIIDDHKVPDTLRPLVDQKPDLDDHRWSIARHLAATQSHLIAAHVAMDVCMDRAVAWMDAQRRSGRISGPIPLLLHAAAAAAEACPHLLSFRLGRQVYCYKSIDIAFTARTPDGRLFTPVVRNLAGRSLDDVTGEVGRLSMAVFRGQLDAGDMTGGAMTVSALSDQPVRFHVGLQNAWQSALLAAGAIRDELTLADGRPVTRPILTLVLSYDHGLMDGQDAASALAAAKTALENLSV
jgi:pyruvate/2-oxoglutarate dehydrogenase complex dihydrolipoamide acyltransferase (E2) component